MISLYSKGMTTGDIANHLADVYGEEVSRDLVSKVTDAVLADLAEWQSRPLDPVYPVILIDAIVMKVRAGQVGNRPVYVATGINIDGHRDVLGMWVGPTGGEGAKQWMNLLTELKNRGVNDVCIVLGAPPARSEARGRMRRIEGPPGIDRRDLAFGDRPNLCRALGPQLPEVRVEEVLETHHYATAGDLYRADRCRSPGPVRRFRGRMGRALPGHDRHVAKILGRVHPSTSRSRSGN